MSKVHRNLSFCCLMFLFLMPGIASAQEYVEIIPTASIRTARHAHAEQLDVNTATADQLQAVVGITPIYAKRIVAGRPYTTKRQLLTHGILPASVYSQVKDELVAHRKKK